MNDHREHRRRFGARRHSSTASDDHSSGCQDLRYPQSLEFSTVASEHTIGRRCACVHFSPSHFVVIVLNLYSHVRVFFVFVYFCTYETKLVRTINHSSSGAYTRCWDDQYSHHFDFSQDGHQRGTLYIQPKYHSNRPKASGRSISAPGSSIVTTPSSSVLGGVTDHVLVKVIYFYIT